MTQLFQVGGLIAFLLAVVMFEFIVILFLRVMYKDSLQTGENYRQKSMQALDQRNKLAKAIQLHRAVIKVPADHDTALYQELRTTMGEWL